MLDNETKAAIEATVKAQLGEIEQLRAAPGVLDYAAIMEQVEETARLTSQYVEMILVPHREAITTNSSIPPSWER